MYGASLLCTCTISNYGVWMLGKIQEPSDYKVKKKQQTKIPESVPIQWTYFGSTWQIPSHSSSPGFDSWQLCGCVAAPWASVSHWFSFSSRIVFCCFWSFFFWFSISCCWKIWRLQKWLMQTGSAFRLLVLNFFLLPGCWEGSSPGPLCGLLLDVSGGAFWRGTCKMLFVGLPR